MTKFQSCKVSAFLGFLLSKFQSVKFSMIPYYRSPISCFLRDIEHIFKMFKQTLDGSAGFLRPRLFQSFHSFDFPKCEISEIQNTFKKELGCSLQLLGVFCCLQRQITLVLAVVDTFENLQFMKLRGFRFSQNES